MVRTPERVVNRALASYDVDENGCWITRYSTGSHGYGQIGWGVAGKRWLVLTHRVSWEAHYGPIPNGMTVDHMCKVKRCMNPDHLRLLTSFDNGRRGNRDWPLGQCANGHPDEFMRPVPGRSFRNCTVCMREWKRENRRRALERGLAADDERHGTYNGYSTYGCRCESCRRAHRDYTREYKRRREAAS